MDSPTTLRELKLANRWLVATRLKELLAACDRRADARGVRAWIERARFRRAVRRLARARHQAETVLGAAKVLHDVGVDQLTTANDIMRHTSHHLRWH